MTETKDIRKHRAPVINRKDLTKAQWKKYRALYMKAWRRKEKIKVLDRTIKGKRGYRAQRSKIYREIAGINRTTRRYLRAVGVKGVPQKKRKLPTRFDTKRKVRTYTATVWDFEDTLRGYLNEGTFRYYVFVNTGRKFDVKRKRGDVISDVLLEYDVIRNSVYTGQMATTPYVDVEEDYGAKTMTISVLN